MHSEAIRIGLISERVRLASLAIDIALRNPEGKECHCPSAEFIREIQEDVNAVQDKISEYVMRHGLESAVTMYARALGLVRAEASYPRWYVSFREVWVAWVMGVFITLGAWMIGGVGAAGWVLIVHVVVVGVLALMAFSRLEDR